MIQIFSWIWVISGLLLILLVLLHSPKGDGMGGIAASGSSMFNSASSAEASLNKITWTFLVIFLSLAIILSACLLYTSPSPRDAHESRMPSSA